MHVSQNTLENIFPFVRSHVNVAYKIGTMPNMEVSIKLFF